ncbi:hypothetical protein L226DRAFT_456872 [Lentinus tigrinus ALCF2SS1-7]|uniref:peptidylprolyl isomerase n=1 Tax=Lentinus tigrinus ALCF2SS1-6 TaxID=1328759 RepID=A0A5C2S2D9_9APHY|nr:hypothetical protein L227DRAFT_506761 [Lentinus tigrinus ALCF2SS1-6]RPD78803.1 hypothetical protein L226DRAFT_456872 [Lentinus tigrinus ALCF2SS1-7]
MRILGCISALLFALAVVAEDTPTELKIERTHVPDNCKLTAQNGDRLSVHYTGKLWSNGNKFDSSLDRGQPFTVTLGARQVITGWEEGLQGMCQGEKRTLTIPASKGYGSRGFGNVIPANSALVFDVELVKLNAQGKREEL